MNREPARAGAATFDFTNRVVAVVGGAGGIGRVLTEALCDSGAQVAVLDLDQDPLRAVQAHITMQLNAADYDSVDTAISTVTNELGPIDSLINVVGFFRSEQFADSVPSSWNQVIAANLLSVMNTCRSVVPSMLQRGTGTIVNYASTAGEFGSIRPAAAYAAAKGGVIAFTKSLAREVSGRGVRANCISPGPIDTAMFASAPGAGDGRTLVGRMGSPTDLVAPTLQLAHDRGGYMTGTVVQVNGGSLL